jgi:lantibiotic transport system permease protein
MNLLISLRSERAKTKRTAALYFTLAAAAFSPLMSMLDLIFDGVEGDHKKDIFNELFTTKFMMTGAVILPWFIILACTLLPQIEYKNNTWKQVLTSPQTRANVFLAKFINVHLLIFLFLLTNKLLMLVGAVILHFMEPSLNVLSQPLDRPAILTTVLNSYLALFALSAIQFWLGLRFRNFIAPIAIGISLWFVGSVLVLQVKSPLAEYFPYSYHMYASFPEFKNKDISMIHWASAVYSVLFLVTGFLSFKKRRMNG